MTFFFTCSACSQFLPVEGGGCSGGTARAHTCSRPRRRRLPLPSHRLVVLSPYSSLSRCRRAVCARPPARRLSPLLRFGSVRLPRAARARAAVFPASFFCFFPVFPSVAFGRRVVSDASHPSPALSPKSRSFVRSLLPCSTP